MNAHSFMSYVMSTCLIVQCYDSVSEQLYCKAAAFLEKTRYSVSSVKYLVLGIVMSVRRLFSCRISTTMWSCVFHQRVGQRLWFSVMERPATNYC